MKTLLQARTDKREYKGRHRKEFLVPGLYMPQLLALIFRHAPEKICFPPDQEKECKEYIKFYRSLEH